MHTVFRKFGTKLILFEGDFEAIAPNRRHVELHGESYRIAHAEIEDASPGRPPRQVVQVYLDT